MTYSDATDFLNEQLTVLAFAVSFILVGVAFLIWILISRLSKTYYSRKYDRLREGFQKTLNAFIILENSNEDTHHFSWHYNLTELRNQLISSARKQLLIDLLIANKQNLSGRSAIMLRKIYIRLGLKKVSRTKLKHGSSLRKVKGLQELAEMECTDALPSIQLLFHHRNKIVRQESFIAMVRLGGIMPFSLMRGYAGSISPWMQLIIHKHLVKLPAERLPKFHYWFTASNKEVKKFAINMAYQFRQSAAIPRLASLLRDNDLEIAGLAANALGDIGASQYAESIGQLGKNNMMNDALSVQIIQVLAKIGNKEQHTSFLTWHMIHGPYKVRMEAMRALHKLKLSIRDFLIDFNLNNDHEFESIYAHIKEPLLQ